MAFSQHDTPEAIALAVATDATDAAAIDKALLLSAAEAQRFMSEFKRLVSDEHRLGASRKDAQKAQLLADAALRTALGDAAFLDMREAVASLTARPYAACLTRAEADAAIVATHDMRSFTLVHRIADRVARLDDSLPQGVLAAVTQLPTKVVLDVRPTHVNGLDAGEILKELFPGRVPDSPACHEFSAFVPSRDPAADADTVIKCIGSIIEKRKARKKHD